MPPDPTPQDSGRVSPPADEARKAGGHKLPLGITDPGQAPDHEGHADQKGDQKNPQRKQHGGAEVVRYRLMHRQRGSQGAKHQRRTMLSGASLAWEWQRSHGGTTGPGTGIGQINRDMIRQIPGAECGRSHTLECHQIEDRRTGCRRQG